MQAYMNISKLILLVTIIRSTLGVEEQGLQLLNTFNRYLCLCPGDTLTYECTVMGEPGGSTLWKGSFLNCISQEIALFHADYESTEGAYGECGDIVGQSVRSDVNAVNGNSTTVALYISRLTVPINLGTVGRTIECLYDDGATATLVGRETVNITIAPSAPVLTMHMSNANFVSRKLTFSWTTDCPAVHYNILASNCGSCPTTTNHTNVTCIDVPTNNSVCTFTIQTVVCGNISGQISYPVRVSIQNPTEGMHNSDTSRVCIISISILAIALIVSVVGSLTMIIIVITRRKVQTNASLDRQLANQLEAEKDRDTDSTYEAVTGPSPSASTISTQDNVAYDHTHKQQH